MVFFISYKNFRIDSTKSFLKKIKFICLRLFSWSNLFISKPSNDLINYHQSKELIYPLYSAIIPQPMYVYIIVGVGVCGQGGLPSKELFYSEKNLHRDWSSNQTLPNYHLELLLSLHQILGLSIFHSLYTRNKRNLYFSNFLVYI